MPNPQSAIRNPQSAETAPLARLIWPLTTYSGQHARRGVAIAVKIITGEVLDEFILIAPSPLSLLEAVKELKWKHGCHPEKFRPVHLIDA